MYESFFGLKDSPFSIAPDPRYLYMSERHKEALAHLLYGLEREGGFVLLTGEVGTGKTTICRRFIQSVPENTVLAFILYPKLTARELLATICDEFGISYPAQSSTKTLIDYINKYLLESHATGKHTALVIDEAQNLSSEVLEQLRLLTNLETDKKKLLQIILLGQPELKDLLSRPELRQLSQRITARYHLGELSYDDLGAYISFRLSRAGCPRPLFTSRALKQVYKGSRGIPRLVNLICDRALLGAYSVHASDVTGAMVKTAIKEIGHEIHGPSSHWWHHWAAKGVLSGSLAALITISIAYWLVPNREFSVPGATTELPVEPSSISSTGTEMEGERAFDSSPVEKAAVNVETAGSPYTAADSMQVSFNQAVGESASLEDTADTSDSLVWSGDSLKASWSAEDRNRMAKLLASYAAAGDDTSQAFQTLLAVWHVDLKDGLKTERDYCRWVERQGLKCLQQEGNWRSLILLNRPVVLKLMTTKGKRFSVPLVGVDEHRMATIQLGGQRHQLPLAELDEYWRGDYSLLWSLPPYESQVIQPGAIQDKDAWLTQQLDLLDSVLAEVGSGDQSVLVEGLDEADFNDGPAEGKQPRPLKERVKEFQLRVGILADGIAGTITLIMLNSWTNPDVPLLKAPKNS